MKRGETLILRWSMLNPSGQAVARVADVVFRDTEGHIETVYLFTGVN